MPLNVSVTFYLGAPICLDDSSRLPMTTLDALLGYAWAKDKGLDKTIDENIEDRRVFPELPFHKTEKCYHASSMMLPDPSLVKMSRYSVVKTTNYIGSMSDLGFGSMPLNVGSGWARAAAAAFWLLSVPFVRFFACVTDIEEFKRLLKLFATNGAIGKKRDIGFGVITDVVVNEAKQDLSIMDSQGFPTRPLPVRLFGDKINPLSRTGFATYYCPYWAVDTSETCFLPSFGQCIPKLDANDIDLVGATLKTRKEKILKRQAEAEKGKVK